MSKELKDSFVPLKITKDSSKNRTYSTGKRVTGEVCKVFVACFYVKVSNLNQDCLVKKSWLGAVNKRQEFLKVRVGKKVSGILEESFKGFKLTQVIVEE
jgi:hypothetical protein